MSQNGAPEAALNGVNKNNAVGGIRDVWNYNLEEEFSAMRQIVQDYPFIAMDTEFPGVVARPIGEFRSSTDYQYHVLKCNVNMLKLIQVGFTFLNERGELPPEHSTWQFHFKFSLTEDMYAQDSIDLLLRSGIQFAKHEKDGIRVEDFGELLMTSGLVLCDTITWLSFHSGYDFGYLMRTMLLKELPAEESEFFELLTLLFPVIYDIKILLRQPTPRNANLKGGLQELADQLQVERIGPQHQAGSDSLLTGMTFFKIKNVFFQDCWDQVASQIEGQLYGLTCAPSGPPSLGGSALPYTMDVGGLDAGSRNASTVGLAQLNNRESPARDVSSASSGSGGTQDSADASSAGGPVSGPSADVSQEAVASSAASSQ